MKKILFSGVLLLLLISVSLFFPYLEKAYFLSKQKIDDLDLISPSLFSIKKEREISTPPPLRTERKASGVLTKKGTIDETNAKRKENGKNALQESAKLTIAAENKARDILEKQYFEHISPSGYGPDFFVDSAGYDFVAIGENLALGDFFDDKDLVGAWMESAGHRENMLNEKFQEIGVAVLRGEFDGQPVWVAVQEFGTPLSICPSPDESLGEKIDSNTKQIKSLSKEIQDLRQEIENTNPRSDSYSINIKRYNAAVGEYNMLISDTKSLAKKYNEDVEKYNLCVKKF